MPVRKWRQKCLKVSFKFPIFIGCFQVTSWQWRGYNVVMCCIVMWALSSAISSLCNSIHPPEMEINQVDQMNLNPPKTACGCSCGGVIIKNSFKKKMITVTQCSHPTECVCQRTTAYTGWPQECGSAGERCTDDNNNNTSSSIVRND